MTALDRVFSIAPPPRLRRATAANGRKRRLRWPWHPVRNVPMAVEPEADSPVGRDFDHLVEISQSVPARLRQTVRQTDGVMSHEDTESGIEPREKPTESLELRRPDGAARVPRPPIRSEEHTSELQSLRHL